MNIYFFFITRNKHLYGCVQNDIIIIPFYNEKPKILFTYNVNVFKCGYAWTVCNINFTKISSEKYNSRQIQSPL